jgi:molybdate transport system substrate-binding protein
MRRIIAAVVAVVVGLLAGCSGSSAKATDSRALRGPLTVFAAASLTDAFNAARTRLTATNPGLHLTYSFAGSQQLVAQIQAGAPADVVATADSTTMDKLVRAGLVQTPRMFARNKLAIVVGHGNPKGIHGLADLARPDLKVVLEDPSVPAGNYARQILGRAGVTVHPVSLPLDVRSELQLVISGDADAGVVYVTDVAAAGSGATGVSIPDSENVIASYPIAVVKASGHQASAQAFVNDVIAGESQRILESKGFLSPR